MNDLFLFLKDLVRGEPEVIAAFVVGVVVALVFLSSVLFWIFKVWHGKKIGALEGELKTATDRLDQSQKDQAELKKKSKDRKGQVEAHEAEIGILKAKADAAVQATAESKRNEEKARSELLTTQEKHLKAREQIGGLISTHNDLVAKYNKLVPAAKTLKRQLNFLNVEAKKFEKLQGQLWEVPVDPAKVAPFRPLTKNSAVIITLINLKGGVGKTTLTANIAATYCRPLDKRVLVIDLDFQASLAGLCLSADLFDKRKIGVDDVLKDPDADVATLAFTSAIATHEQKMRVLSGSENLPSIEERSKARWLVNPGNADLRCVFRRMLHAPLFQDNFDVILIDCPPRWSTSSINAIACCDYVLIPTLLDRVSSEAVPRLLKWLRNLKSSSPDLYANFDILGLLGNRAFNRSPLIEQERGIWEGLPDLCQKAWGVPIHRFATIIREKSEIHRAANRREFAAQDAAMQPTFLELVQEIEARRSEHEGR